MRNLVSHAGAYLKSLERRLRSSFGNDISTPGKRRAAHLHYALLDHSFLRVFWHNFHKVADGAYRANQPSQSRLGHYSDIGFKSIINLRGDSIYSQYLFEEEACSKYGLTLWNCHINSGSPSSRDQFLALLDAFERAEKPFLMHCKSGADRAGLASAVYLLHIEGASIPLARQQLHWKYLHLKSTQHGILDSFVDLYEQQTNGGAIPFRDWVADCYKPRELEELYFENRQPTYCNSGSRSKTQVD